MDVVLKVYSDVHKAPDVAVHEMYREVAIHSGLQHPSIVHLYAAFEEGNMLVLVQEFVPGGDLLGLMAEHGGRCDETTVVSTVLRPLLGALLYLHRWGVVHRDVKPENVLFAEDGSIRVIDFGLAINMIEERPISRVGTLDYMAPEVLRCPVKQDMSMAPRPGAPARYGFASDVWAIGIVTYELLTGLPPYAADCRRQAETLICSGSTPVFPHCMSPAARDFILRALAPHPGDRPTVRQMLQHPWILDPAGCAAAAASAPVHHPVHLSLPAVHTAYPTYGAAAAAAPSGHSTPVHPAAAAAAAGYCAASAFDSVSGLGPSSSTFSSTSTVPYNHAFAAGGGSGPSSATHPAPAASTPTTVTPAAVVAAAPHAPPRHDAAPQAYSAVAAGRTASPASSPHASATSTTHVAEAANTSCRVAAHSHQQAQQLQQLQSELSEQLRSLQEQQIMNLSLLPMDQIQDMIQKLQQAMHLATQQQQQHGHAHGHAAVAYGRVGHAPTHGTDEHMWDAAAAAAHVATHVDVRASPATPTAPHAAAASPFAAAGVLASHILCHGAAASYTAATPSAPSAPCTASFTSAATDGTCSPFGSRRTTGEGCQHARAAAAAAAGTLPSPAAAATPATTAALPASHQTCRASCGGSAMHDGDGLVIVSINGGAGAAGAGGKPAPGVGAKGSLEAARDVAAWLNTFVAM